MLFLGKHELTSRCLIRKLLTQLPSLLAIMTVTVKVSDVMINAILWIMLPAKNVFTRAGKESLNRLPLL